jgi:CMP/dCMP kinase
MRQPPRQLLPPGAGPPSVRRSRVSLAQSAVAQAVDKRGEARVRLASVGVNRIDPSLSIRDYRSMNKEIITVAGSPGSGKSSTAKAVASALEFRHFSSGDLFRQLAAERGESIEAMNISAEVQRDIDLKVDNLLQEMYRNEEKLVIDSRMAWRWMPCSFKVFLVLDPGSAAQRIFNNLREEGRQSEDAKSVEEARASIDRRFASEQRRYRALYGVNPTDPLNFDLVINTKHNNLTTVTAIVLAAYEAWRTNETRA